MEFSPSALLDKARSPEGQKALKYTAVSVISFGVYVVALAVLNGLFRWRALGATISANIAGGIPSYYLNRAWAWGKSGRSHLWREIVPFWVIAFIGAAFSIYSGVFGEHLARSHTHSHVIESATVLFFSGGSFLVLWVFKFVIFNKFIFITHGDEDLRAALADEIVA